ncbi:MAG: hypothetical protein MUO72_17735 [Bacteroidales bacterium]|nr:hypothetical protein [Bacteroidales bacterium]
MGIITESLKDAGSFQKHLTLSKVISDTTKVRGTQAAGLARLISAAKINTLGRQIFDGITKFFIKLRKS